MRFCTWSWAWPRGSKTFSCSTQLSTKFILLIKVKMSTILGILTFISMINTTSERLKARNFFIYRYFSFYEQLKFPAQLSIIFFNNLLARSISCPLCNQGRLREASLSVQSCQRLPCNAHIRNKWKKMKDKKIGRSMAELLLWIVWFCVNLSLLYCLVCVNTCLDKADRWLLGPPVCDVFFSLSHTVSWVLCGTWLYWILIFAFFPTLGANPTR